MCKRYILFKSFKEYVKIKLYLAYYIKYIEKTNLIVLS
jgi:hypothetical protein